MAKAMYAFSGDPITFGHIDIIQRASQVFDHVIVGIGVNPQKQYTFSLEERTRMAKQSLTNIPNVEVVSFSGLLVDYAVRMREAGKSIDETAKWVESNKLGLNHWFTVDSLSHLHRGGRVTGAAAFVGNLLHIKPVLNVDYEGHLIPREKEQGRRRALKCLLEKMEAQIHKPEGQQVFISHGDDAEDARKLAEMIRERFPDISDIMISPIGAVIGAHSGPGTIALFFMGRSR